MKAKSLAFAYFLVLIFGLQGVHQFYLGNYRRGFTIFFLIHGATFLFAYLEQQGYFNNPEPSLTILAVLLGIMLSLLIGLGLWLRDVFTLKKQV